MLKKLYQSPRISMIKSWLMLRIIWKNEWRSIMFTTQVLLRIRRNHQIDRLWLIRFNRVNIINSISHDCQSTRNYLNIFLNSKTSENLKVLDLVFLNKYNFWVGMKYYVSHVHDCSHEYFITPSWANTQAWIAMRIHKCTYS